MEIDPPLPRFFCLFSEDVRQEAGGTVSLIGVMAPVLDVAASFPLVLPKLGVSASVLFPREAAPREVGLVVEASWTEEPLVSSRADEQTLRVTAGGAAGDPDSRGASISFRAVLSPVPVPRPGRITAFIELDGNRYWAGSLRIRQAAVSG